MSSTNLCIFSRHSKWWTIQRKASMQSLLRQEKVLFALTFAVFFSCFRGTMSWSLGLILLTVEHLPLLEKLIETVWPSLSIFYDLGFSMCWVRKISGARSRSVLVRLDLPQTKCSLPATALVSTTCHHQCGWRPWFIVALVWVPLRIVEESDVKLVFSLVPVAPNNKAVAPASLFQSNRACACHVDHFVDLFYWTRANFGETLP